MDRAFDPYKRNFSALSVRDLLDARDLFHVHLSHLAIVCGTAVGLYLIRDGDADANKPTDAESAKRQRGEQGPRTLDNASARKWSWPCLLVFVQQWLSLDDVRRNKGMAVPPFIYLPDGRIVPVCTVLVPPVKQQAAEPVAPAYRFTSYALAPGYPIYAHVQGEDRFATAGCVVSDGRRTFVLSSQHVTGATGDAVFAEVGGHLTRIGAADSRGLAAIPFSKAYPSLPGRQTVVNLDAGLIAIDDAAAWTAQVFGLGTLGALIPFDADTASLDWIGRKVVAHGAKSGPLAGEIRAMFYRYRTVGGRDSVTDFLIGGRDHTSLPTLPGDSGTLWCVDPSEFGLPADAPGAYRPVALQWGGAQIQSGAPHDRQFALAASLAVICRELNVDVIADVNLQRPQYWGATGHYKIAELAIKQLKDAKLKAFMLANLDRISFDDDQIDQAIGQQDPTKFVALADVPDYVWKTSINRTTSAARPQENWAHYADMDLVGANGKTLYDVCGTPPSLDLAAWIAFYKNAPPPKHASSAHVNMGSLPFRIWQMFDELVDARRKNDATRFLCASGILAHYIGDSCQPLHGSIHADGLDGAQTGVHSQYEDHMIDVNAPAISLALDQFKYSTLPKTNKMASATGAEAGRQCVELMQRVRAYLPPERICTTYDSFGGGQSLAMIGKLWGAVGDDTIRCLADGTRTLALLWDAAYAAGTKKQAFSGAIDKAKLKKMYEAKTFVPSVHLANLDPGLYKS